MIEYQKKERERETKRNMRSENSEEAVDIVDSFGCSGCFTGGADKVHRIMWKWCAMWICRLPFASFLSRREVVSFGAVWCFFDLAMILFLGVAMAVTLKHSCGDVNWSNANRLQQCPFFRL